MEAMLPPGVGVLGVDEHTAVIVDIGSGVVTVHGAGGMTLRANGSGDFVPAGESISMGDLAALLNGTRSGHIAMTHVPPASIEEEPPVAAATSLRGTASALRTEFDARLAAADAEGALAACLDLEDAIHAWAADTLQSDDVDVARQTLRSMLVDLAGSAVLGLRDPRAIVGPIVQVALDARLRAREARDFATSDLIRDELAQAGIDVRDTPEGMVWSIVSE
jgi:cysteinyl-tRNA synthetase